MKVTYLPIFIAEQLSQLAKDLVAKYPYLTWPTRTGEGWEPWKKSLYDKMSNLRKDLKNAGCKSVTV